MARNHDHKRVNLGLLAMWVLASGACLPAATTLSQPTAAATRAATAQLPTVQTAQVPNVGQGGPVGASTGPVLLLTHPELEILKNYRSLRLKGWLAGPTLQIIAIYPRGLQSAYDAASRWLQRHATVGITLQPIDCEVAPDQAFQANACTLPLRRLFDQSDGIIFSGGPDLPPALYGQDALLTTIVSAPQRQYFEISLLAQLFGRAGAPAWLDPRPNYAVLGICMGLQELNVALGGTLVQDIPSQRYQATTVQAVSRLPCAQQHKNYDHVRDPFNCPRHWNLHPLRFVRPWTSGPDKAPDAATPLVVTAHHQSIAALGAGLEVLATSADGQVIEAVRHTRYANVLAVQFHPEYRSVRRKSASDPPDCQATCAPPALLDMATLQFHEQFWREFSRHLQASYQSRHEAQAGSRSTH